jgi:hypothetical protein
MAQPYRRVVGATYLFPERNIRVAEFRAFSQKP